MVRLIGLVLSIGLADSMNPGTIAPGLYLASGPRARRDLIQFTLGVFLVYIVGGVFLVAGPGEALLALVPKPSPTVRYVLEIVAGTVMLVVGAFLYHARRRLGRRKLPDSHASGASSLVLGITLTAVELPTAFPYFAAVAAVIGSDLNFLQQLFLVVLYDVCFVLPLLVMIAVVLIAGDEAERILSRARELVRKRWPVLLAVVALLAGGFVVTLGATGLAGNGHGKLAKLSRGVRGIISQ